MAPHSIEWGSGCARSPPPRRPTMLTGRPPSRSPCATTATTSTRSPRPAGCRSHEVVERHHAATYRCAFCGFAPGFALPHRSRPGAAPPSPGDATHPRPGRIGRHRRGVHRRVPVGVAGRLAPPRAHRRGDVGRHPRAAGARPPRHGGQVRAPRDAPRGRRGRLGDDDPGRRPARVRRHRRADERGARCRAARRAQPARRQPGGSRGAGDARWPAHPADAAPSSWRRAPTAPRWRSPPARRSRWRRRPGTLWGYVAVRGGIAVDPVLGSRSHDSRSGLGPPPVTTGSRAADRRRPGYAARGRAGAAATAARGRRRVARPARRLVRRRRARRSSRRRSWTVSPDVSRVGARLDGTADPPAGRRRAAERGTRDRRRAGPRRRPAGRHARRPPDDRRVPGAGRRRPTPARRGGAGPPGHRRCGSASYIDGGRLHTSGGTHVRPSPLRHLHGAVPPSG